MATFSRRLKLWYFQSIVFILSSLENPDLIGTTEEKFFEIIEKFLEVSESVKAKNTIKGYNTVFNYLKKYERYNKIKIKFETIDLAFFESLRSYSYDYLDVTTNYFSKIIAVFKTFMNWSYDHGYHQNLNHKKFKAPEIEKEVIALTLDELMTLFNTEFKLTRLEHVKDTFCFACFTGLRFIDLVQLRPAHIRVDYLLKRIQKTNEIGNKIPLNKFSLQILKKYADTIHYPLPKVSNQKYNEYLKECCEIAKIDTPTVKSRQSGRNHTEEVVPKWEVISSHVARKTFITNSLVLGMSERVVKSISGHKKDEHFRKYVKIAEDFKKSEMNKTWNKI